MNFDTFEDALNNYINLINRVMNNPKLPYNTKVLGSVGKKYIKLIKYRYERETGIEIDGASVYGFIVIGDDKKFNDGDMLKANSWKSPARNFARGNIFKVDENFSIKPYGI